MFKNVFNAACVVFCFLFLLYEASNFNGDNKKISMVECLIIVTLLSSNLRSNGSSFSLEGRTSQPAVETSTSPLHVHSKDGADSRIKTQRLVRCTYPVCPTLPSVLERLYPAGSPCQRLQRWSDNHKAPPPGFRKPTARDRSSSRFGSSHRRPCPDCPTGREVHTNSANKTK